MTGSAIGWLHFGAAVAALLSGAGVLLRPKAGVLHRAGGYFYAGSMLLLNLSALSLYRLSGKPNFFHFAALVSLATVLAGVAAARRRRAGWLERHYRYMGWSYIGLLAALVAESATRLLLPWLRAEGFNRPGLFWLIVAVVSSATCIAGARVLNSAGPRAADRAHSRHR